jgi:hypothetical protein
MKKIMAAMPILALLALPLTASAHGHTEFEINGVKYGFVVGSLNEPVTVDDKTGLDMRITKAGPVTHDDHAAGDDHDEGAPVIGLEETLQVEMIAGEAKKITDISPAYGVPGAYRNAFYPTVATTLSYRVFGTIEGTPFNYTFTCNPAGHAQEEDDTSRVQVSDKVVRTLKSGGFGCPSEKADLGFPEKSASVVELNQNATDSNMIAYGAGALALAALAVAFMRRRS